MVTSGFEVPAYAPDQTAEKEVHSSIAASPAKSTTIDPAATAEAVPPREFTGPDPVALNQMSLRELEDRIRVLEARLAEQQTVQVKNESPPASPAPGIGLRGSDEEVETSTEAKSARDEEIERKTEERATKMASDIRAQLKQLEGERARQLEEMLDAAK